MGNELLCTMRYGRKSASGKALLESNEIIFRGDPRLKIPLASLTSVVARDGNLHVTWAEDSAIFELGPHAAKWADKILHPKSTFDKLGIKPGLNISAVSLHDRDFLKQLRAHDKSFSDSKPSPDSDLIFFGVQTEAELKGLRTTASHLAKAGALWVVYPKGRKEINEQQVLDAGRKAGLIDVKVVSFSATHTALKFVHPKVATK